MLLAVSWTPLDVAGTPTPGAGMSCSAPLGVCHAAARPAGRPEEGPRQHGARIGATAGRAGWGAGKWGASERVCWWGDPQCPWDALSWLCFWRA